MRVILVEDGLWRILFGFVLICLHFTPALNQQHGEINSHSSDEKLSKDDNAASEEHVINLFLNTLIPSANGTIGDAGSNKISEAELDKFKTAVKNAGRLVRAVLNSGLDASQIDQIGEVIQKDAPTSHNNNNNNAELYENADEQEDSKDKRSNNGADDENFVSTPEQAEGADWMFKSQGENPAEGESAWDHREGRALGFGNFGVGGGGSLSGEANLGVGGGVNGGGERLFSAKRFCGFSPRIDASRLSNCAPGQYPWSVAIISNDNQFLCSGSLVSESIVLTTATCVLRYRSRSNQPLKVILGAWSLPDGYEFMPELEVFVSAAVLHPNFNQNLAAHGDIQNNIALLRLVENLDFDLYPHIFPICLVGPVLGPQAATSQCQVLGWPNLPVMESWRSKAYLASGDIQLIKKNCAAHPDKGPCVQGRCCVGNEGSVVQCLANSNRFYQWGMVVNEPNCNRDSSATVSIVNVIDHYDFISGYLWTPNPNPQRSNAIKP